MPTPQGIKTVTLHGRYVEPDLFGTPISGQVTFTPNVSMVTFPTENTLMAGTETATLNSNGEFTIDLPCTDTAGQNPVGWTYTVTEKLIGVRGRTYQIALPFTVAVVELSDITPTDATPGYLPVTGPQGPPGVVQSVNGYTTAVIVLDADDVGAIDSNEMGAALGVATLDINGKLTSSQVPDLSSTYILTSRIGAASGVAGLDAGSKVPSGQLDLANDAPPSVGTGAVGTSTQLAREDHTHDGVALTGNQSIAGIKGFTGQLGVGITSSLLGRVHFKSTSDETTLILEQTATGGSSALLSLVGSEAATKTLFSRVTGDTVPRIAFTAGGNVQFSSGGAAADAAIYRSAAGVVSSTGQFASDAAAPTAAHHLTRKDYVDSVASGGGVTLTTNQSISGVKTFTVGQNFYPSAAGNQAIGVSVAGDSVDRMQITGAGVINLGPGNAARDTNLYRSAADELKTDDSFVVGSRLTAGIWDPRSLGIHNVKAYGALGNDTGDDSTGINAALAAATTNGGQVIVPPGIYRIGSVLKIFKNTRLTLLPGAEFRRNYAGTMILNGEATQNLGGYTGQGNIIIEGGLWNMRGTTSGLTASAMCISIGHAYDITIRDLEIRDVPGYHAIELNSTKRARIMNCYFRGYVDPGGRDFSEAIQLDLAKSSGVFGGFGPYDHTPCEDVIVDGCYFGASGTASTTAWPRGVGSHSATITRWHKRTRIIGNTFEGILQYACSMYNYNDLTIVGNTFTGCGSGVRLRSVIASDPEDTKDTTGTSTGGSQPMDVISVVGNTFSGGLAYDEPIIALGETSGVIRGLTISANSIDGSTSGQAGIRLQHVQRATINGNQVANVNGTGISTEDAVHLNITGNEVFTPGAHGITAVTVTQSTIADNEMKFCGNNGLLIQGGDNIQVRGNYVKSPGRATNATWYGMRVSTSASSITFSGNKTRPNGSGNEAINGLSISSTCSLIHRYGNDWRGSQFTGGPLDDLSTTPNTTATDITT